MIEKLALISVLSSLATEGTKKLLDETHLKYSCNVLASIVSVFVTLGVQLYVSMPNVSQIGYKELSETFALMFLSFLTATVGYDKVAQLLGQMKK